MAAERDRDLVERALDEARGGSRGVTGAEVTVVSNGIAELLEPAEGVAAILRY